jgi:signal transduction histidine kinase
MPVPRLAIRFASPREGEFITPSAVVPHLLVGAMEAADVVIADRGRSGGDDPHPAWLALDGDPPADACTTAALLGATPVTEVVRAWVARRLDRPLAGDDDPGWLAALAHRSGALHAAFVRRSQPLGSLTLERLEAHRGGPERILSFGADWAEEAALVGAPSLLALFTEDPEPTCLIVAGTTPEWARAAVEPLRAAADARDRLLLRRQLRDARAAAVRQDQGMRRVMFVITHQLRNVLFPIHLGVKVIERQQGPIQALGGISHSLASADALVRRLSDLGRALDGGPRASATHPSADLAGVVRRLVAAAKERHPQRTLNHTDRPAPDVPFDEDVIERIAGILVENALVHGDATPHPRLEIESNEQSVAIVVTNTGTLPFTDLYDPDPDEPRGRGLGLLLATRLAQDHGLGLQLGQEGEAVVATLRIPLGRPG